MTLVEKHPFLTIPLAPPCLSSTRYNNKVKPVYKIQCKIVSIWGDNATRPVDGCSNKSPPDTIAR